MSDDDFGFEFVDDATEESAQPPSRLGWLAARQSPAGSGERPVPVSERDLRRRRLVAGGIAAVIVLIVIVVVATSGSGSAAGSYRSYLGRLAPIATGSHQVGVSLGQLLTRVSDGRVRDPSVKLGQLTGTAQSELASAEVLKPPAGLRAAHEEAVSALDLRVRGLQGLRVILTPARAGSGSAAAGLTSQIDVLVTSDVLWRAFVWEPAVGALKRVRVAASVAPQSVFLNALNLSSPGFIATLVQPQQPSGSTVLRLGSTGPAVSAWQKQLNRWLRRYQKTLISADGNFGPGTQTATEALQGAAGLTPDGVVGTATRKALQTALGR